MHEPLPILLASTITVGVVHTLLGPDHYLPFIVLGRAEGWPLRKTMFWTFCCGLGHVLSSILVGGLGAALGWALGAVESFEGIRGQLAAYALIAFGLIYFLWGIWRGRRGLGHSHLHLHADGSLHTHPHPHQEEVAPAGSERRRHEVAAGARVDHEDPAHVTRHRRTLWVLFIIFVLGPCEPLIALLLAPAARHDLWGMVAVAGVFSVATVTTMMITVGVGLYGLRLVRLRGLERYAHAMAGFAVLASGLLIQLFGL